MLKGVKLLFDLRPKERPEELFGRGSELEEVLRLVLDGVTSVIGFDRARLYLIDERRRGALGAGWQSDWNLKGRGRSFFLLEGKALFDNIAC